MLSFGMEYERAFSIAFCSARLPAGSGPPSFAATMIARESFENIAALWAPILGREVSAVEVALCMIQLKVARALNGPEKRDSWVDMCGYAALGGELAHEDHENRPRPAMATNDEETNEC